MNHHEIGSEFWNVPVCGDSIDLFPAHTSWYLSGRSALAAVIKDVRQLRPVKTVSLPSWCCESMIAPIEDVGIETVFYPVTNGDGGVSQDFSSALDSDLILVMGFFGMSNPPQVPQDYEGIVVEDLTHSLLSAGRCERADYRFGSLRKWCGVWTGGYAWRCDGTSLKIPVAPCDQGYVSLRRRAMEEKSALISHGEGGKSYLATFSKAEEWLDAHVGPICADQRDVVLGRHLDIGGMSKTRRANAGSLLNGLHGVAGVTPLFQVLMDDNCPLFVPILLKNTEERDSLRRYLIENDVYCPIHWPISDMHKLNDMTRAFYIRSLSLVCDQRYDVEDMQRIVGLIESWQKTG